MGCGASAVDVRVPPGAPVQPASETTMVQAISCPNLEELRPLVEEELLLRLGEDGCLADLEERTLDSVLEGSALSPFSGFNYRLYSSASATSALRRMLRCTASGTNDSYEEILSAISCGSTTQHYCYLVGGQVRDVLRGQLSTDVDFNYSCTAREVALATVSREWPTKYKLIGEGTAPNYVLIGDESTDSYLEGFSIQFNATKDSCHMDFRQNMLLYDLTNDLIIDKTGYGVQDIRSGSLRLSCAGAKAQTFAKWATSSNITPGFKQLRYIKFLLRAMSKGKPLETDSEERAFVVKSLGDALKANREALGGFWFSYAFGAQLATAEGIAALKSWVTEHGQAGWWEQDWEPLMPVIPVLSSGEVINTPSALKVSKSVIVTNLDDVSS